MYDYGLLKVEEFPAGSPGYGKLYVGTCWSCKRVWSSRAMDREHGTENLRGHFRGHHKAQHSREECPAGVKTYSTDYERYKLRIKTPQNDPASRYIDR